MNDERKQSEDADRLSKLRRFVQLAPQDPEVHLALACALMDKSLQEEAAAELHTVISLSPNHLAARKLLQRLTAGSPSRPG
jgi:Flp pilus assembly protein TadD